MEKTKRVLAILMAVLMVATVFPMNAFAVDSSDPISLDKTTFSATDVIKPEVYNGGSDAWVGLYSAEDTIDDYGTSESIAYEYVSDILASGSDTDFNKSSTVVTQGRAGSYYLGSLVDGDYVLAYFTSGSTPYGLSGTVNFSVSGGAATVEPSFSVNKTTFCVGEPIKVTAVGFGESWVGIFDRNETPGNSNPSYFWYYINPLYGQSCVSGETYVIQEQVVGKADMSADTPLEEGKYSLYYFSDGSYTVTDEIEITIKGHGETEQSGIEKATFEKDGAVNGACVDCSGSEVIEVIGKATASLAVDTFPLSGSAVEAAVTVKSGDKTLTLGTDYEVSYKNNTAIGTATATVTLKGDRYEGSIDLPFYITEANHEHQYTITNTVKATLEADGKIEKLCSCDRVDETQTVVIPAVSFVALEKTGYAYTGSAITPAVIIKDAEGTALASENYTVAYANNTEKGDATVTVTLKGDRYEGTKELTFSIGLMEINKGVFEQGEEVKIDYTSAGGENEWIGLYYKSSAFTDGASISWAYTSVFESGLDVANYYTWSVLVGDETADVVHGDAFNFQDAEGVWHLLPGEYKIAMFADGGFTPVQVINFVIKEKELRQGVTVATDKATYSENDTINVTVTKGTTEDAVAIYKKGATLPLKKVMLSADGKAVFNAKYFDNGTYTAVVLQENVEDFKVATSAEFSISRTTELEKTITTNKTTYCGAEEIKVSAVGGGKDWVGLFHISDMYDPNAGGQAAYFWYYVNSLSNDGKNFYGVGDEIVLNSEHNLGSREGYEFGTLEPGSYKVVLLENDRYDVLDQVEITIKGHSYEVISKKDSTCEVQGYEKYKCTVCGYETSKDLDYADHNWNEGTLVSNATCSKDTVMNFTCLDCGENENLAVTGTATGHNYVLTETKEATCSVPGYKKYICSKANCDAPEKKEEITVSHEYVEQLIVEPTCTDTGLKMNVCKWCSAAKDNGTEVPANGHSLTLDKTASTAADCQKAGVNVYKCSNCAYSETRAGEAQKQHSYKEAITPATTSTDGKIENKCEFCGTVSTSTAIAKASDITLDETVFVYEGAAITPIVVVRDANGKSLKVREDFTVEYKNNNAVGTGTVVIKFTGVKYTGEKTLTFTIKSASGSSTPPTPTDPSHKHTEVVVKGKAATCTATGLTDGKKCSVCGEFTVAQKTIAATGHKEVAIAAKAATYKATGLTAGKKCSVCGTVTVAQKKVARKKLKKVTNVKTKAVVLKSGSKSTLTLSWKKVTGAEKYVVQQYVNKKWKTIKTTSKTSYKVTKLKANKSYKFRVRAKAGKYYGSYSKTYTAKTVPLKPTVTLKAGKKQLTASWKQVANITGYEVQYSTSKKFTKKTTKTVTIKKAKTTKKTVKKLTKGKKYYVRVRTYKTLNGKKIYSSWSTVKNVKVK